MKRRFMKLTNSYHNTDHIVRVKIDGTLTYTQVRRAWRKLCGIEKCTCGDVAGCRPAQIEQTYEGDVVTNNKYSII